LAHIFISYARKDRNYVRSLVGDLRRRGFEVWYDDRIGSGDRWWQTIVQAIRNSAAFIVVMTPDSEKSKWVERELLLAEREGKPIFPLLRSGQEFSLLIDTQYVDVSNDQLPPEEFHDRLGRIAPFKSKTRAEKKVSPPPSTRAAAAPKPEAETSKRWSNISPTSSDVHGESQGAINKFELLEILEQHILIEEIERLVFALSEEFDHSDFKRPWNSSGLTQSQQLIRIIRIVESFGPGSIEKLCVVVKSIRPGDRLLHNKLDAIMYSQTGSLPIGTETVDRVAEPDKLATMKRRLSFLQEQKAKFGYSSDPSILMEIEDLEKEIKSLEAQLENFEPVVITWLHLSDLHLTCKDNYIPEAKNQERILSALWDDIENHKQSGINFDYIFFCGDLAYSGSSFEYRRAKNIFLKALLEKTGLDKSRLFIVPGNHDVDWQKITPGVAGGTLAYLRQGKDYLTRLLIDKRLTGERSRNFSKLKYFQNFVNDNANGKSNVNHNKLFFSEILSKNKNKIGIVGLNSAWMCGLHKDADGKVDDQGKLLIGEPQIDEAIKGFDTKGEILLKIGVMHHPPEWLHPMEKDAMTKRLISEFDILLHGHYHEPGLSALQAIGSSTLLIPAGALYQGRNRHNSYNFVQLDFEKGEGSVMFRKYVDSGPEGKPVWQKDIETTGEDYDGTIPLEIVQDERGLQIKIKN